MLMYLKKEGKRQRKNIGRRYSEKGILTVKAMGEVFDASSFVAFIYCSKSFTAFQSSLFRDANMAISDQVPIAPPTDNTAATIKREPLDVLLIFSFMY